MADAFTDFVTWLSSGIKVDSVEAWFALGAIVIAVAITLRYVYGVSNPKGRQLDDVQFAMPYIGESFEGTAFEMSIAKDKLKIESLRDLEDPEIDKIVDMLLENYDNYFVYIIKLHRRKRNTLKRGWLLMLTHEKIDDPLVSGTSFVRSHYDAIRGHVNHRIANQAAREGWVLRKPGKHIRIDGKRLKAIAYYPHVVEDDSRKIKIMDQKTSRGLMEIAMQMGVYAKAENKKKFTEMRAVAAEKHARKLEKAVVAIAGERNEAVAQAIQKRYDQISGYLGKKGMSALVGGIITGISAVVAFDPLRQAFPLYTPQTLILAGVLPGILVTAILEYRSRSSGGSQ